MNDTTVLGMIMIVFCGILFFLPSLIARKRNHHNMTAIFLLNLFLGFTGIGWIVALVWAFSKPAPVTVVYWKQQ